MLMGYNFDERLTKFNMNKKLSDVVRVHNHKIFNLYS